EWQRLLHAGRVAGTTDDTVLMLEHPAVYTAGRRTQPDERPPAELASSAPVIEVDRGGKITFHGPGQLVGYPVVALPDHVFVVDYVRRVEEAVIAACADLGVHTGRVRGRTGVWVAADPTDPANSALPERKIAALGVRVSRGVTMHGFAVNADVDLSWFDRIVPCGIADAGVTSLSAELDRRVRVDEVADAVEPHLRRLLSWQPYDRSPDLGPAPALTGAVTGSA
ncbi:MAG: lipoyl(octanoyl) transferase LipB, partial [Actinomycetota bacterium]|nr:lipoyl(octanoyl) transferase LipB [Actinomycetota bacterium]